MIFKALLFAIAVILILPTLRTVWRLSLEENQHTHHPGTCRRINKSGTGSEDIQIMTSGLTFITSGISYPGSTPDFMAFTKSKGLGRIEIFDMNSPDASEATSLKIKHGDNFNRATFRPHGLSVLEDKTKGEHLVYVVNHAENGDDRVEKFRYLPKTKELQHLTSFSSELFRVTNDLAVVSEDKFYISNFFYSKHHALIMLEQLYNLPVCNVLYYNGTGATPVLENVKAPNGIILSKDGRFVYVSFPNDDMVRVYERRSDFELRQVQEVIIHTSLDNFLLSHDGKTLFGGCHPNTRKIALHLMNPENRAPSQVLRIPLKEGLIVEEEITQQFYDHGELITASTVAGEYRNRMIIGSVIDSMVVCQLPMK